MVRIITSITAHLRPVRVEHHPGRPTVVRYSTQMQAGLVLRHALPELSNEEALLLADILGIRTVVKEA